MLITFNSQFDGIVPPHFYGVMAKTELGCQVLREKGHFTEFAHFIRQHGMESEDQDLIIKLKSILWAVVSGIVSEHVTEFPYNMIYREVSEPQKAACLFLRLKRLYPRSWTLQSSLWCFLSEGLFLFFAARTAA